MAISTTQFAVIKDVYYDGLKTDGTNAFVCNESAAGNANSTGTGSTSMMLTKGETYYFILVASGNGVTYPYGVAEVPGSVDNIIGWYTDVVFPPATYKITYDANGGTGAPATQTKTYQIAMRLSTTKPIRVGHTFLGWATSATATEANQSYAPGSLYTTNGPLTLYAVWDPVKFDVTYDANGGSGAPEAQVKSYGTTLQLSTTVPTRTGYRFLGWSTSDTATTATYQAGSNYTANAAATLYAVWSAYTFTVNYYSNFATEASPNALNTVSGTSMLKVYTVTYYYGTAYPDGLLNYTESTDDGYLARTGYDSTGYWSTSMSWTSSGAINISQDQSFESGAAIAAAFGKSIDTASSSISVYPAWQRKTYAVTYNQNTTDTVTDMPSSQTKTYGTTLQLSTAVPKREQYEFKGWAVSSTGEVVYAAGSSYNVNEALNLYAVWELAASKVAIYDSSGVKHTGLCYIYDSNGAMHYAIITVYDSEGNAHTLA